MGLPDVYAKVVPEDHVRALEDAISWSLDHALEDLATIELVDRAGKEIDWDDLAFLSGLPSRYRHRYTPLLAKRFVVCLVVATEKMADPDRIGQDMFSCVAEELAAHLVIQEAEAMLATERRELGRSDEEIDFGDLYEFMFEDFDFGWLYDPEMDGIERDHPVATDELGVGNLAFERWFRPFSRRVVHPYAAERTTDLHSAGGES